MARDSKPEEALPASVKDEVETPDPAPGERPHMDLARSVMKWGIGYAWMVIKSNPDGSEDVVTCDSNGMILTDAEIVDLKERYEALGEHGQQRDGALL